MADNNKKPDFYDTLEVKRDATADEIRKSFRRLARKYHPDVNPNDKKAEEKFKEVSEANDVLSDEKKRKNYDRFGQGGYRAGQWTNPDVSDSGFNSNQSGSGNAQNSGYSARRAQSPDEEKTEATMLGAGIAALFGGLLVNPRKDPNKIDDESPENKKKLGFRKVIGVTLGVAGIALSVGAMLGTGSSWTERVKTGFKTLFAMPG